jgi:hypothetical protein
MMMMMMMMGVDFDGEISYFFLFLSFFKERVLPTLVVVLIAKTRLMSLP